MSRGSFIYDVMEDITTGLQNVQVSEPIPLVVDALNYLSEYFYPRGTQKMDPFRAIKIMQHRVVEFVKSARKAHYEPVFVIDSGWKSDENNKKWMKRREKEVRDESRFHPLNADDMLALAIIDTGCVVHAINGVDADDVVVKLAEKLGPRSLILSGDRDMFRYVFL